MGAEWVSIIVPVVGSVFSGVLVAVVAHYSLKASLAGTLATIQAEHKALAERCEEDRALLNMTRELHGKRLGAHELEIGLLKRGQPMDYAR